MEVYRRKFSFTATREYIRTYIRRYTSPNDNLEYGYTDSNALLQSRPKSEPLKPHEAERRPTKYEVINDIKRFPTVYCILSQTFDVLQLDVALQKQLHTHVKYSR